MSIMSWKLEFYPPISKVKKNPIDSIEHSLNKWIGLCKENLEKHELKYSELHYDFEYLEIATVKNKTVFYVDSDTCSLCRNNKQDCKNCPISIANGQDCLEEFEIFRDYGEPVPMILLLRNTLDFYKEQNNNRK